MKNVKRGVSVGVGVMEGVGVSEGNEAITVCTAKVDTSFMKACLVAVALDAGMLCWQPENSKEATKIPKKVIRICKRLMFQIPSKILILAAPICPSTGLIFRYRGCGLLHRR